MKKRILTLGLVLALVAVLVMPTAALADTQTVTGSTAAAYTITTTVAFGPVLANSSKTMADVITATADSTVGVEVANASANYMTGRLTKLEYKLVEAVKITITAPTTDGAGVYTVAPASAAMTSGQKWALKAYTGAAIGAWDPVVITLTAS